MTEDELDAFMVDHIGRFVTAAEKIADSLDKLANTLTIEETQTASVAHPQEIPERQVNE